MKKKFVAILAFFSVLTCSTTSCEAPTQKTKNIVVQLGLHYGKVNHLNNISVFDKAVASGAQILVKFGAPWCPPCRRMAPILKQLAPEFGDVLFIEVNMDSFKSLANRYGVRSLPTVILFKGGAQISKTIGFRDKHHWVGTVRSTFN